MSARQKDLLKYIEYPESGGKPMGETDKHILLMMALRFALDEFFKATEQVYIGSNLMCYYVNSTLILIRFSHWSLVICAGENQRPALTTNQ